MSPLVLFYSSIKYEFIFVKENIKSMWPNFPVLIGCAFIPFLIAYVWFHPKVFGGETWQRIANLTDPQMSKQVNPIQLLLSIFLNFLIAVGLFALTVHATHVLALTGPDPETLKSGVGLAFMQEYGNNFQSLSHGIGHGLFFGLICFAIPILGYAAIFERKSFKYILVNAGFWGLSMTIMAMIISRWGGIPV